MTSFRDRTTAYIQKKYGGKIEYPWMRFPEYGVFRHADNQKWYVLFMALPGNRLGLQGEEVVEVMNVKLDDLFLRELLLKQDGYFPGYHISRGNWISVLLDGTVGFDEVCGLIDRSYRATASAGTKKKIRPPKEWIIPSNPNYYDIVHAFDDGHEITMAERSGNAEANFIAWILEMYQ